MNKRLREHFSKIDSRRAETLRQTKTVHLRKIGNTNSTSRSLRGFHTRPTQGIIGMRRILSPTMTQRTNRQKTGSWQGKNRIQHVGNRSIRLKRDPSAVLGRGCQVRARQRAVDNQTRAQPRRRRGAPEHRHGRWKRRH